MKEFIDKLIGRFLAECVVYAENYEKALDMANQLAEEYNKDFCEWQEKTAGGIKLVKEPHKQRLFHIEEERQFCPYCGKKIKIAPYQPKGE